ncbi:MAG: hypothetical protein QE285_20555 [Aquabacterium sp.]|nr:hypothetical protein [Aquabacterium sp.]
MENFSTLRAAVLPRATNLLTVAVLVAATWWSGTQRPADQPALAAQATASATQAQTLPGIATPAAASTLWPAQATALPRDGVQAVGYQPRTTR